MDDDLPGGALGPDPTPRDLPDAADDADRVQPGEGAPAGGGIGRTLLVGLIVLVALGVGAFALAQGGGDAPAETAGPVAACGPEAVDAAATPLTAQGLQPEPEPDALPPATLCAFDEDTPVEVTSLLGDRPLVVNFWATWCAPCIAEMPEFQQLHEAGEDVFHLVGINTQDAPPLARDFAADLDITYTLLRDPRGAYFTATNGFGMPTTLFVTPEGDVTYRHTGPLTIDQMAALLQEHLDVVVDVPEGAGA